ncbi:hypothetical protein KIW84_056677 [Lathyrus oleraceus]|uniref:Uncharacterized protein n=1 Tax=Pisum sativum TaxID=3888 RepID=A0A9D4X1K7_PEA|nr:hypothetical protein KIW84_056677 [Pisum sativum]
MTLMMYGLLYFLSLLSSGGGNMIDSPKRRPIWRQPTRGRFCFRSLALWCNSVSFIYFEDKLTHRYYTRANISRLMDHLEQENREPMRQSGVVVKAFDGSRKTVIGEVDLPIKIGPSDFQITFQMLRLKLELLSKLYLLLSLLRRAPSFASYKDAKLAIMRGATAGLGKMIELEENESRAGIGFSSGTLNKQGLFKSGGFIHTGLDEEVAAVLEEDTKDSGNFIIPGGVYNNWIVVDIPTVVHKSTLISKPVEHNDPTPSPNFEFSVFEAEEDDVEEIPDEITSLLEHEEKIIQPHLENLETVNLGSEDCVREVKIGALLEESVKKGLIKLLREYVDVFSWSYEDMPGLGTDIVQHFLPLKPECMPVKQKLRRTHPDMAVKIKEEVQKQIDAGFLVTSTYPQWVANIVPVPKKDGKVRIQYN